MEEKYARIASETRKACKSAEELPSIALNAKNEGDLWLTKENEFDCVGEDLWPYGSEGACPQARGRLNSKAETNVREEAYYDYRSYGKYRKRKKHSI